jgi:hypothetical protein
MSHLPVIPQIRTRAVQRRSGPNAAEYRRRAELVRTDLTVDNRPVIVYLERPRIDWTRTSIRAAVIVAPIMAFLGFVGYLVLSLIHTVARAVALHLPLVLGSVAFLSLFVLFAARVGGGRTITTVTTVIVKTVTHVKG